MLVTIKDKLFKDIQSYCSINDLDVETYINDMLKKSFMIEKYGIRPGRTTIQSDEIIPIDKPIKEQNNPVIEIYGEFPPVFTKENGHIPMEKVIFPQLTDVKMDYSKQEELKPEIPMSHDIDEETLKQLIEENVKPKHRKLTKK